jgi:hypothetical protein
MTRDHLTPQLQQAIRGSGMSLNSLSELTGVDDGQLSRFMRNERTFTLPVAAKLCTALGLELKPRPQRGKRNGCL